MTDEQEILALVVSLAHAQDRRDWSWLASLFAPEVHLDFSAVFGNDPVEVSAEALAQMAQETLEGFDVTHHTAANVLVDVDGDSAEVRCHVQSYHQLRMDRGTTDYCLMRGFWEFEVQRIQERWRIRRWSIIRTAPWEGDPSLYQVAASRRSP